MSEEKKTSLPLAAALPFVDAPGVTLTDRGISPDDYRAQIDDLRRVVDSYEKAAEKQRRKIAEIASDRDRWKARADRAELMSDGLALERVTKERDGLKAEVSILSKRLIAAETELKDVREYANTVVKRETAKALLAEERFKNSVTTMEQMQRARDNAQKDKETAEGDRVDAVKRVHELETTIEKLKDTMKGMIPAKVATPPAQAKENLGDKLKKAIAAAPAGETIDARKL